MIFICKDFVSFHKIVHIWRVLIKSLASLKKIACKMVVYLICIIIRIFKRQRV